MPKPEPPTVSQIKTSQLQEMYKAAAAKQENSSCCCPVCRPCCPHCGRPYYQAIPYYPVYPYYPTYPSYWPWWGQTWCQSPSTSL